MPKFKHLDYAFEIPDEWWREAGMDSFVPRRPSYQCSGQQEGAHATDQEPVEYIALALMKPVARALSDAVFNDEEGGLTARERVVRLLRGFVNDDPIPPVRVVKDQSGAYELVHGADRFYCSVAAAFSEIPAIDVSEPTSTEVVV